MTDNDDFDKIPNVCYPKTLNSLTYYVELFYNRKYLYAEMVSEGIVNRDCTTNYRYIIVKDCLINNISPDGDICNTCVNCHLLVRKIRKPYIL